MNLSNLLIGLLIFFLVGCSSEKELIVDHLNLEIQYSGRIDISQKASDLYWPGSSITINFKGKSIAALLKGEKGENYFNIIIDRDSVYTLRVDTLQRGFATKKWTYS